MLFASAPLPIFPCAFIGDVRQWREVKPTWNERAREVATGRNLNQHRRFGIKGPFERRLEVGSRLVRLLTSAKITRLLTSADGRAIVAAEADLLGRTVRIEAKQFVVSAGAVNSAALLLRSRTNQHPDGLGNASGLLGRNYMVHNSTFFVAIDPRRRNTTAW